VQDLLKTVVFQLGVLHGFDEFVIALADRLAIVLVCRRRASYPSNGDFGKGIKAFKSDEEED